MQATQRLLDVFERNASRTLLIDAASGAEWSYGRFLHESRCLARFLQEADIAPGDPVVLSMENCIELALLYFACMHAGARVVPVNPSYHPRDFAAILGRVSARHFFTTPAVRARVDEVLDGRPDVRLFCFNPAADRPREAQRALVNLDLATVLAGHGPSARTLADNGEGDVFLTMYTSGSTGLPKGINITCGGLLGNGRVFCEHMGIGPEHRFLNILAMTYLGGIYNLTLLPILAEGSVVLDAVFGPTNVFAFWERVREHQVNTLWFSPTMLSMLLALEDDEDLGWIPSQVRLALVGMAPLPVDLKKRFEGRFGFALQQNYALSETTFLTTTRPGAGTKLGSVGTALPGVDVLILGDDLKPLPSGQEGQIGVRTPYLMKGYDQDVTAPTHEGLFLTGDVGRIDGDGELFVTGRLKDLIILGGVNISPKTIEDVLYGLEGVQEAAVVGVPHPVYGEEVALVVRPRESFRGKVTTEAVRRYCEANIAHFQRPKLIYLLDEIPKGATGKIHKATLRTWLVQKMAS